jgi:hypothetical protein
VPSVRWFGTRDAARHIAQREGNGAIADLLTCGRPLCDDGQAVKSSKGYGTERDAREIADGKPPSSFGWQDRVRQRWAWVAKERRGSDAMTRTTGLNRLTAASCFGTLKRNRFVPSRPHLTNSQGIWWFSGASDCAIVRKRCLAVGENPRCSLFAIGCAALVVDLGVHPIK